MYNLNIFLLLSIVLMITSIFGDHTEVRDRSYCEIREPKYRTFYNLTALSSPEKDVIIQNEYHNETIRMQLCSTLLKKCNGKDNYAICLVTDKEEIGIGNATPSIISDSGQIVFTFLGDKCKGNTMYTVKVIMKCDYSITSNSYPEKFPQTDDKCNYFMIWKTALACSNRTQTNCTFVDPSDGSHYDLSPLTSYSDNYVITMSDSAPLKIILNVCHSIIFEYDALCEMHSGICLRDATNTSEVRYLNLGNVHESSVLEITSSKELRLNYNDGSMCLTAPAPHIETTIIFICDFKAVDTLPEYIGGSENCHYQLIWKTAAACSVESLQEYSTRMAGTCTVTNPLTNFTYNLQTLMNNDFKALGSQGTVYNFRVCESHRNDACKTGTGVCLTKNGTSLGMANAKLIWQQGGPYLNYTEGDKCDTGQYHYTVIAFLCGAEGTSNTPVVIEEQTCQLLIHWNSDLACEERVKCSTINGKINLNPLMQSTNYIVKSNDTEFHINVCRPLIPTHTLRCAHGSAACKTTLNSKKQYVGEINLGFPKDSPQLNENKQIVLRYVNGSSCSESPRTLISTNLTFLCDYDNEASPRFKEYVNCTYVFEWKTRYACESTTGEWIKPYIIKDHLFSHEFDLSFLTKDYQVKNGNEKYDVRICGEHEHCRDATVCKGNISYGSSVNVIFDYSEDIIKLKYSNGSKCKNSFYTSEIMFICNEFIGIGEPTLLRESQCTAVFEWQTNVTCVPLSSTQSNRRIDVSIEQESVQQSSSSHALTVVAVVVVAAIVFSMIFLYFRNTDKKTCLRCCLNSCNTRRGSNRVKYCRVDTNEEARLLLDAAETTQCQSDSDDDLLGA